ncbi:hypothetical protein [Haloplanus halophilus]|uniref:hypothetical protein n=1 Tax=Haloplanus halophilus TaxID=2949993 RepID=UPI00203EE59B|nr:hypothetical protein [Haloplanus sp. GDY1]
MSRRFQSSSLDDCLRALEHDRRRDVLTTLSATETLDLADLGTADRDRLSLVHHHLPVLDDLGYVEWESETGRVGRGPRFDEIDALLELLRSHEEDLPWAVT